MFYQLCQTNILITNLIQTVFCFVDSWTESVICGNYDQFCPLFDPFCENKFGSQLPYCKSTSGIYKVGFATTFIIVSL